LDSGRERSSGRVLRGGEEVMTGWLTWMGGEDGRAAALSRTHLEPGVGGHVFRRDLQG
jgi:hypothetical protein